MPPKVNTEAYWHICVVALIKEKIMLPNAARTKKVPITKFSILRKRIKRHEYGEFRALKPRASDPDFVNDECFQDDGHDDAIVDQRSHLISLSLEACFEALDEYECIVKEFKPFSASSRETTANAGMLLGSFRSLWYQVHKDESRCRSQ